MKSVTRLALMFCLASTAVLGVPAAREAYLVVRLTDHADEQTYTVMSAAAMKETEALYAKEARLHSRALSLAERDWKKDEGTGKAPFPRSAVSIRSATVVGRPFDSESAATANLMERENRIRDDVRRKAERDKESKQKRDRPPTDLKREGDQAKARDLYTARLQELLTADETPAATPEQPAVDAQ